MKKYVSAIMAVIVAFTFFTSCKGGGSNVEKDIVGKWNIQSSELSNIDEIVDEMASQLGLEGDMIDSMKDELKSEMEQDMSGSYLQFNEDHTVDAGEGNEGSWSYDKDNNKIIIKTDDGQTIDFIIDNLSGDDLNATFVISDNGVDFKMAMVLKRE